jgi:DNA repair photolyase
MSAQVFVVSAISVAWSISPRLRSVRIGAIVRYMFDSSAHEPPPTEPAQVDGTSHGVAARGRGSSVLNPGNRFEPIRLHVLGDYKDEQAIEHPQGVQIKTQAFRDHSKTIINRVAESPDIPFGWSLNPYRGCEHGCIYCYARPGHEYLGMSCGLDFETKIMVKLDAPNLLRRELAKPSWKGERLMMSGVTDCYQPIEAQLRITRGCMEVMAECCQPVSIVTKNKLVLRDLDLLKQLAAHHAVNVAVSVTTLNPIIARKMEPRASSPAIRLHTIRELAAAGIPVTAMVAPVVPGLTDTEMPAILKAVADAGATSAGWVMLRLPHQIKALFLEWLMREFPQRASRVEQLVRDMRGGKLYDANYATRMRGEGQHAQMIESMFKTYRKRYGLDRRHTPLSSASFRKPTLDGQLGLFDQE